MSEDNNRVIVSGKVVNTPILDHTLYGEEFYTFDISIPRLSGTFDVLPLTVSNRLMGNGCGGQSITVKGRCVRPTSNRRRKPSESSRFSPQSSL